MASSALQGEHSSPQFVPSPHWPFCLLCSLTLVYSVSLMHDKYTQYMVSGCGLDYEGKMLQRTGLEQMAHWIWTVL